MGEYPWLTANCGDFDITGHRRPVSYWREIVWGLRPTPYLAVRPPAHHGEESTCGGPAGRSPTRSRRGRGPASRASPSRSRSTPTPTRWSSSSTARRSVGARPARPPLPRRVRDHVRARRARRGRVPRRRRDRSHARWSGERAGRCSTCRSTATRIDADRPRPRVRRDHARRRRRQRAPQRGPGGHRRGRRTRQCSRASAAATRAPRRPSASPTHDTFNGRALAVVRPTGAGHDHRHRVGEGLRRPHASIRSRPRTRDLGAALAPVPGRVGAVHRAPRRAPVDRRDRRRRRARRARRTTRWRRSAGGSTPRTPTTAACSCSPTTSRCSRPTRPEPSRRRRPVPHPARGRHRRGGLLPPRPHEVDGRPRRRRGDRGGAHVARPHRARCRRSTASPTC